MVKSFLKIVRFVPKNTQSWSEGLHVEWLFLRSEKYWSLTNSKSGFNCMTLMTVCHMTSIRLKSIDHIIPQLRENLIKLKVISLIYGRCERSTPYQSHEAPNGRRVGLKE